MKCHEKEMTWLLHTYTLTRTEASADITTFSIYS